MSSSIRSSNRSFGDRAQTVSLPLEGRREVLDQLSSQRATRCVLVGARRGASSRVCRHRIADFVVPMFLTMSSPSATNGRPIVRRGSARLAGRAARGGRRGTRDRGGRGQWRWISSDVSLVCLDEMSNGDNEGQGQFPPSDCSLLGHSRVDPIRSRERCSDGQVPLVGISLQSAKEE